jgi:hypothetical protein
MVPRTHENEYVNDDRILLVLEMREEQLDEITKRRQPLVIEKRGNYAYVLDESTT